jgi:hypothetical protein
VRTYLERIGAGPRIFCAAVFCLIAMPSYAGPCSSEIDRLQAVLDAKIGATAQAGQAASEGDAALLHRQPTPGSIAGAESKLGEGAHLDQAVAALAQAREADGAGDQQGCERAVTDVRRALGP